MIFNAFPDLQWLKAQAESRFKSGVNAKGERLQHKGWPSVILNVQSDQTYRDNIRGPLSIFCNLSGESMVKCDGRSVKVRDEFFFVSNHDQYYTLEVGRKKAETFNIHFGEYFADEVFASLVSPERLLDNNYQRPIERMEFHNKLHSKDGQFNQVIQKIRNSNNDRFVIEEGLYQLMGLLLKDSEKMSVSALALPPIKCSTKTELMRRLSFATDYIYSFYDKDLTLEEIASASCLSKFHFLRLFKIAFNQTPYQFVNMVRMKKAQEILRSSKSDVMKIGPAVGIKDSSSFSRMFKKRTGVNPSQYRASL